MNVRVLSNPEEFDSVTGLATAEFVFDCRTFEIASIASLA
jgi:hypothetical protein